MFVRPFLSFPCLWLAGRSSQRWSSTVGHHKLNTTHSFQIQYYCSSLLDSLSLSNQNDVSRCRNQRSTTRQRYDSRARTTDHRNDACKTTGMDLVLVDAPACNTTDDSISDPINNTQSIIKPSVFCNKL